MEKIIERGLLFDFYGDLLTEHQQHIYSEAVFNDLSLQELSEAEGISRQGIHDIIKRCDRQLMMYEEKLGLISKFQAVKGEITDIETIVRSDNSLNRDTKDDLLNRLKKIIEDL